ncbi:16S rRNA (guanine(966)-N(2))-methyltransferase RsmD [Gammaproteobacteria bacterium]|nr:16S rRNA (guanine(966)-N(2))-methyltransferase RsmD [Gammaproteobacteria bacterium]
MTNSSSKNKSPNVIRIIAGKWRSRKLPFVSEVETLRPTPDRVRETVFNWLQAKIIGARCLDLFAGSGALAYEACSRGAATVTAIDNSSRVKQMLQDNCDLLNCTAMKIILADSLSWLEQPGNEGLYDIVFLDPPYSKNVLPECCRLLDAGNFLAPGCAIYLESDHPLEDIELPSSWRLLKSKKAGQVYYGVCERLIN